MKRNLLNKLALGGATIVGIIGFASPAALAWDGNSNHYDSSYGNSSNCYNDHDWDNSGNGYSGDSCQSRYSTAAYNSSNNNYGSYQSRDNCGQGYNSYGASYRYN